VNADWGQSANYPQSRIVASTRAGEFDTS